MEVIDLKTAEIPLLKGKGRLVVADLHLHDKPAWRVNWQKLFIDELLQLSQANDLDLILLGDTFESCSRVRSDIVGQFLSLVLGWKGNVYCLAGQHDSFSPSNLVFRELSELNHITVIDKDPEKMFGSWWGVPFNRNSDAYRQHLNRLPDDCDVWTHMPVKEAIEKYGGTPDPESISSSDFEKFNLVYSGDIHKPMTFGNLEYIGAPGQRDWRDSGVEGNIGLLCEDDRTLVKINTWHVEHIRVKSQKVLRKTLQNCADNWIKCSLKLVDMNLTKDDLSNLQKNDWVLEFEEISTAYELQLKEVVKKNVKLYPVKVLENFVNSQDELPFTATVLIDSGKKILDLALRGNNED